ncbi:MAG: sigma 54-interacting transcriptional regulator [Proteobacteria bacterium]|nr:sigma 54-interacting transcriptional regulator [Pseudomonadota bacterium]
MDENSFFKKATLLICSSLDIEIALWRCREFIAEHIPADEMYLNIYEPSTRELRYIARADRHGGVKLEKTIKLPGELAQAIEGGRRLKDYLLISDPEKDPMGRIICKEFGFVDTSLVALRLIIDGHRLGVMDVFAKGHNRLTEAHARLIRLLREPFAIAMANALKHQQVVQLKEQLVSDNRFFNRELIARAGDEVIGAGGGLKKVMESVAQVAPLKNTVLLVGETGTGKEVIANAIHRSSPRRNEPLIKVNCGAIPENLIDSELFGHEKGAFTGAIEQKRGRFERANKGTIFLDEIGELPSWAQVRLLRVLQTQEVERVGGSPPIRLDIRVIVATHRDLHQMVRDGEFREDLWFRINAFPIHIPPLRQRKMDIPELVEHFLRKKAQELGIQKIPAPAPVAIAQLTGHTWPGNVRELENAVERALIKHRPGPLFFNRSQENPVDDSTAISIKGGQEMGATLDEIVRHHIVQTLESTKGRVNGSDGAAARLAVHPNTLRSRMRKLNIPFGRKQ